MVVIHVYLEKDNGKFFKFHINNSSFLEINVSLFKVPPSNKYRPLTLRHKISPQALISEIRYL